MALTTEELEAVQARIDSLQPAMQDLRDWINTNRQSLNTLLTQDNIDIQIPVLPKGDVKINDPAFSKAYRTVFSTYQHLAAQQRTNEFPSGRAEAFKPIEPANEALLAYGNLYVELGDNAPVSENPAEAIEQAKILNLKNIAHGLTNTKAFSQVPKFNIKENTLNPADPAFLKSLQSLRTEFDKQGFTGKALVEKIETAVDTILADPKQDQALKQQLIKIADPFQKLSLVMKQAAPPQAAQEIDIALQIQTPPPSIAAALNNQIAPQAGPTPANPNAPKTQQEAPQEEQPTLSVMERIPEQVRYSVLTVEEAFEAQAERGLNTDKPYSVWFDEPDGVYDPQTQDMVEDTVMSLFERYGAEYINGEKTILSTQGDYIFTFDKNGSIFTSEFKDGEYIKKDKVGHITDGIHTADPTLLHEATVQFMERMNKEMKSFQGRKPSITGQNELDEINKKQDEDIKAFFSGSPELQEMEGDFRNALKDSKGIGLDPFKATGLGKSIKGEKGQDDEFATFMAAIFMSEQNRVSLSTDIIGFDIERTQVSSIFNLFQVMTGSSYDPNVINDMYVGAPARDNVLSLGAYNILPNMKHGDTVSISRLYDENNPEQKAAILKEFEGKAEVTREEIYSYVRKQVDLKAIGTLRPDLKDEIAALKTPKDQEKFINDHLDVLKNVSQAMLNGDFNPYEEDLKLMFRATPRPELTDPTVQSFIELHRNNGTIPTTEYALRNMSDNELISLTGNKDFNTLPMSEKESLLKDKLNVPMSDIIGNPAHERLVMNFYEPIFGLGEFSSWRSGDPENGSPDTWNVRYGNITNDERLHMFTSRNWSLMDEIFEPGAQKMIFKGATKTLNYDLTYDEMVNKLREADPTGSKGFVQKLDDQLANLNNPSMYSYLMDVRLYHYRDMRVNSYLPKTLVRERLASEEFEKNAKAAEANNDNSAEGLDNIAPGAGDSPQTQQKELSDTFTEQLEDPFIDNLFVPRARGMEPAPSKVIPKGTSGAADNVLRALEIADNAKPYSQKHAKAMQTANNIMKMHDMTEAQVRLYGLEKGQNLIPAHKLPPAQKIVRALEIADNATPYSAKHTKAMQTANNIMKMSGLNETQVRLHGITLGKNLIPEGTESSATRIARALEIADNAPTLKKQTAALSSAQNMMKMSGLTEAQVRTHTAALDNPKLIKTLEAQAQKAERFANAEARAAKIKDAANNVKGKATETFEATAKTAKSATEKLAKQTSKVMKVKGAYPVADAFGTIIGTDETLNPDLTLKQASTVKGTTTNTGATITVTAQETINPNGILNAEITGTPTDSGVINTKANVSNTTGATFIDTMNIEVPPENITTSFEGVAQNTGEQVTSTKSEHIATAIENATDAADDASTIVPDEIKSSADEIIDAGNDVKTNKFKFSNLKLGDTTKQNVGRGVMGLAAGVSWYHAYSTREEGTLTTAARSGVAMMDTTLLAHDLRSTTLLTGKSLLKTGGAVALVTTTAEVGIALHNKDGQAAGAATIIGGSAMTGMAVGAGIGSVVPVVGTGIGAVGGTIVGAVGGGLTVAYTGVENGLGRMYNGAIYEGSWLNDGMLKTTQDIMDQAKIYLEKLEAGNISQAELAQYHELIQEIEDHAIDLKNAEAGLIENAASWNTLDKDDNGSLSPDEAGADSTAAKDFKLLMMNQQLQSALTHTRVILSSAYDVERHGQLSDLLNSAANATELEKQLKGDFSHVTKNLSSTWQSGLFWNNQENWRKTILETKEKIDTLAKQQNVSAEDANDMRRTIHNTRDEVEERIQNLLHDASEGDMDNEGFEELKRLKLDLETIDQIEKVLWMEPEVIRVPETSKPAKENMIKDNAKDFAPSPELREASAAQTLTVAQSPQTITH